MVVGNFTMSAWPKGFIWGAATSAFQIEGDRAGRGPSVWDAFCRRKGAVFEGHNGDVACDHIHRWREDIELMRQLGVQAYRFSIAWPRVLPTGRGRINEKGFAFYDRLVDALLAAGIEPWITLFHWDFPLSMYRRGGWLNRDSADWFADYAALAVKRLSDRVRHWMTLNEPQCFVDHGHRSAMHAPGLRLPMADVVRVAHHSLLAHGRGVKAMRAAARRPLTIGIAQAAVPSIPHDEGRPEDRRAAMKAMADVSRESMWNNVWWSDPILLGRVPAAARRAYDAAAVDAMIADVAEMAEPIDFIGVNIYSGGIVRGNAQGRHRTVSAQPGAPRSLCRWLVLPRVMYWATKFFYERYRKPVVVTENGISLPDWVDLDGRVRDPARIDFTRRYLNELQASIREGVDVRGYFHWSLIDNFEWSEGYKERFGLIHVDFSTGLRTLKESAKWYREWIESSS